VSLERQLLGPATVATTGTGLVVAVISLLMGGGEALVASVVGAVLVIAFLLLGQLPVALAARGRRGIGAFLLLVGYGGQVGLLLLALLLVLSTDVVARRPLGLSVIAGALAWTLAAVWTFVRWKPTLIEPLLPEEQAQADRRSAQDRRDRRADHRW
jgi:hypothetical protein